MDDKRIEQALSNISAVINTRTPFTGLNEASQIAEDLAVLRALAKEAKEAKEVKEQCEPVS